MTLNEETMPELIWASDGGPTDHYEFMAGFYTNSPTYGVGEKEPYIRQASIAVPDGLNAGWLELTEKALVKTDEAGAHHVLTLWDVKQCLKAIRAARELQRIKEMK